MPVDASGRWTFQQAAGQRMGPGAGDFVGVATECPVRRCGRMPGGAPRMVGLVGRGFQGWAVALRATKQGILGIFGRCVRRRGGEHVVAIAARECVRAFDWPGSGVGRLVVW